MTDTKNKSYLEIEVPIEFNNPWLAALRREFEGVNVRWQKGFYHITMAFINRIQPKQHAQIVSIIDEKLVSERLFALRLNALT